MTTGTAWPGGASACTPAAADGLNPLLAALAEGDVLTTAERLPSQHFTEPPPRFSLVCEHGMRQLFGAARIVSSGVETRAMRRERHKAG